MFNFQGLDAREFVIFFRDVSALARAAATASSVSLFCFRANTRSRWAGDAVGRRPRVAGPSMFLAAMYNSCASSHADTSRRACLYTCSARAIIFIDSPHSAKAAAASFTAVTMVVSCLGVAIFLCGMILRRGTPYRDVLD